MRQPDVRRDTAVTLAGDRDAERHQLAHLGAGMIGCLAGLTELAIAAQRARAEPPEIAAARHEFTAVLVPIEHRHNHPPMMAMLAYRAGWREWPDGPKTWTDCSRRGSRF